MKYFFCFLSVFGVLSSKTSLASAWDKIEKRGSITIATDGTFAPFNFFKNGKLTGFEYDLGQALAAEMKLKAVWKTASFDTLLIGLSQKRFDMVMASHGMTPERAKIVSFSDPHYCTGVVIVSHKNGPRTLMDMKGRVGAVQTGSIFAAPLSKVPGIRDVKTFKQDTEALQALLGKRVDAWVTDKFVAEAAIVAHRGAGLLKGETVLTEKVGMAVHPTDKKLLLKINEALAVLFKNGTYEKLSRKYFGENIACKVP